MGVPQRVRSYKTNDQTDRMADALQRRYSLLIGTHSQLIRFLIQRQWMAEFEPKRLQKWEERLRGILGRGNAILGEDTAKDLRRKKKINTFKKTMRKKRQAKLMVIAKDLNGEAE